MTNRQKLQKLQTRIRRMASEFEMNQTKANMAKLRNARKRETRLLNKIKNGEY